MTIEKRFKGLKAAFDTALGRYIASEKDIPVPLRKAIRYSLFPGGKRIRPILVMESSRICGGSVKGALPAACAVELAHAYSLVHDDLPSMDDDDYRRGKPSCHKAFGEASAILAGDAMLTMAFNVIAKDRSIFGGRAVRAIAAVRELSDAIGPAGMVGGQVLDLEGRPSKISKINALKTARLFEASCRLGAIAASSDARKIAAMAGYGFNFGMAFQIKDDMADREGYARTVMASGLAFGMASGLKECGRFIWAAKKPLKIFGKKAEGLIAMADYILSGKV
ncbi:MAG: polyprenyl synthetase family protein [Candidatus Omnitrophota bacterium]|nr:polyprenyl synthetase family protein [Candidatus Omnitrophota bacterium]